MQKATTVATAGARTGWSARMLRYIEDLELVVPTRSPAGYRLYAPAALDRLHGMRELRTRFKVGLSDLGFALRLRREPALRSAVDAWLEAGERDGASASDWLEWEQRKQNRILAA
jgi:MerR family transcriptional regulator, copper efflux regulator